MLSRPKLTANHVQSRLTFAEAHVWGVERWETVWFSDEKRFTLEGPDGYHCYFHDLRKEKRFYEKQSFVPGLCVWGAVNSKGKTALAFTTKTIKAVDYQRILTETFLPAFPQVDRATHLFMQDGAKPHTAKSTSAFLQSHQIRLIPFPPNSPDLNPIENVWGWLVRRMFGTGQRYESLDALRAAITAAWDDLSPAIITSFVSSMPLRIAKVLEAHGRSTSY